MGAPYANWNHTFVSGEQRVQQSGFLTRFPGGGVPPPTHCPNNGSFVTWLSGRSHLNAALCLRRQLIRVRSLCPLLLVYDDNTVPSEAREALERAYGAANVISISSLRHSTSENPGRRLYQTVQTTLPKLWIWALPPTRYPRLFYMDLDVLVNSNIDDLLAFEFNTTVAAVPCPPSAWYGKHPRFNAGVLLLKPDIGVHRTLKTLARWSNFPWNGFVPRKRKVEAPSGEQQQWYDVCAPDDGCREPSCLMAVKLFPNSSEPIKACRNHYNGQISHRIERACAPKIGDQSIHNAVLRNNDPRINGWTPMPPSGVNVDARELTSLTGARLIHFLGEPKPWANRNVSARDRGRLSANPAIALYREMCADLLGLPKGGGDAMSHPLEPSATM